MYGTAEERSCGRERESAMHVAKIENVERETSPAGFSVNVKREIKSAEQYSRVSRCMDLDFVLFY